MVSKYILEKKYLKLCKHCGKAFTAPNLKTEYDTFSCKIKKMYIRVEPKQTQIILVRLKDFL